jgi:hypothetical protein
VDLSQLQPVGCDEAHTGEIVLIDDVFDGAADDYPGAAPLGLTGVPACVGGLEEYVGGSFDPAAVDVLALYPTESSWADGDRAVVCSAFVPEAGTGLPAMARGSVFRTGSREPRDVTEPRTVPTWLLDPGNCVAVPDTGPDFRNVTVVPCSRPHQLEVVMNDLRFFADFETRPAEEWMGQEGGWACAVALTHHTGQTLDALGADTGDLDALPVFPDEQTWAAGDRALTCLGLRYGADGAPATMSEAMADPAPGPREVSYLALDVGDCLAEEPGQTFLLVPCDEPHIGEMVLADMAFFASSDRYAPSALDARAEPVCTEAYEAYVGRPLAGDATTFWYLPTEQSWSELDDRSLLCLASTASGERTTGSVRAPR